jgi:hypothetical protein
MAIDIADVMAECKNHFQDADTPCIEGDFALVDGVLTPNAGLAEGDYIAITGSRLNDGVYLPTVDTDGFHLTDADDEAFTGRVWILHPPRKFIALVAEIAAYVAANAPSAVTSESFGNYSRSMATNSTGAPVSWPVVYADRLRPYRRMFKVVPL